MYLISKNDYDQWAKAGFSLVPVVKKIRGITINQWLALADKWRKNDDFVLLQSGRSGRYSYVGHGLLGIVKAKNGVVWSRIGGRGRKTKTADPLTAFKQEMEQLTSPRFSVGPNWLGGAAGYFSYDMARYFERLPQLATDDLALPDFYFLLFRDVIAYDHAEEAVYIISNGLAQDGESYAAVMGRVEQLHRDLAALDEFADHAFCVQPVNPGRLGPMGQLGGPAVEATFHLESFVAAVKKVQDYITRGDVFQVNLSLRQSRPLTVHPWKVYQTLLHINPSPYMAYLQFPEFQVVCGSPELLIRVKDSHISTRPIAGTRPRGENREEDTRLTRELLLSEKERAEHIMLVDLERNDLGKVCRYGSVNVQELMVIEQYSHVMHIVSSVDGQLAQDKDAYDAIRACFPGGTITGAPKVRTMEIIEELEPVRRGIYTGSIGWIGFNGDLELNIVIRTLLAKDGRAHVQAGAGIVFDSKPEAEYRESLKKAEALWQALQAASGGERLRVTERGDGNRDFDDRQL